MEDKKKKLSDYKTDELFELDPYELTELLNEEFGFHLSVEDGMIETADDLKKAGMLMTRLANTFPYLAYLSSIAKIKVRKAKRDKNVKKDEIDDAIDRKEAISNITEAVYMQYNAISRLVTVKQQINEELRMTDGR